MYKTPQAEKLTNILKNITTELIENNKEKNIYEERVNKIKKAFSYIETQMDQYVSKFSFDENCKNNKINSLIFSATSLQNDDTQGEIKLEKEDEALKKDSKNEETFTFLSTLGAKDIQLRQKEFEEILNLIEKEFDIEILEKIEDSLIKKKEKQKEIELKNAAEDFKEKSKEKNLGFSRYVSIRRISFNEDNNFLNANKKQTPEKIKNLEEESKSQDQQPLNKAETKVKLCEIEKKIRNYLTFFQKENFFKKKSFLTFIEEDNFISNSSKKFINPKHSIISCFFDEEICLQSAKKKE